VWAAILLILLRDVCGSGGECIGRMLEVLSDVFDDVVVNVLNVQCCHLRTELCVQNDDVRLDLVGESREATD
jgi:hypothetical protein